ncbi:hypothetical protein DRO53_03770 [Candidatus Bathyarchaeota archaeon]|nr:MAG: hypothetical protein DRO53_03770 [Candidatus Bathyarchaeota archaeon]
MELTKKHLALVVAAGKVRGPAHDCEYYPCHFEGQDCTWCFCPFYPCGDPQTGGEWLKGRIWSCSNCNWIHRPEVAHEVLKEILQLVKAHSDINKSRKKLLEIYSRVKAKHPLH